MTDEELAAIDARATGTMVLTRGDSLTCERDRKALVAEVRRLRAVVRAASEVPAGDTHEYRMRITYNPFGDDRPGRGRT